MTRIAVLIAVLFPSASFAHPYPCIAIKAYVAVYGEHAAVQWARDHGYSDRQITEARKQCLSH